MQRSALRAILLAILCLSVLALAAATLDSTQSGGSGLGSGGGSGGGDGPGDGGSEPTPQPNTPSQPQLANESSPDDPIELCAPIVKEPPVIIAVVLAAVVTFLGLLYWYNEFVAIAGTVMVFGPIGLIMLVFARCERQEPEPNLEPGNVSANSSSGGGGVGGGDAGVVDPSLPVVALAVIGILVVLGAVAYYLTGDDTLGGASDAEEADEEEEADVVDATDVAEVGRLAGEAADRIEASGDFENEVFRAWREMTRPLSVPKPQSSTPAEFADAAVAAGMNDGDVERLTELFDEVRYGGREATPEREREAVSLLRSVEDEYADVESAGGLPADGADGGDGDAPAGDDGEVTDE